MLIYFHWNYSKNSIGRLFYFTKLVNLADEFEYTLINDLLDSYNQYARPSKNHDATKVTMGLSLTQIIDVVNIYFYIMMNWLKLFNWLRMKKIK